MKALLLGVIFAAFTLPSVAGATIPVAEVSVAGLTLGETLTDVAKAHSMPDRRDGKAYVYDKGLRVEFVDNALVSARIKSDQYQSTFAGVTVGTSADALIAVYGKPDIPAEYDGAVAYIYTAGDRELWCNIKDGHVVNITAEVIR